MEIPGLCSEPSQTESARQWGYFQGARFSPYTGGLGPGPCWCPGRSKQIDWVSLPGKGSWQWLLAFETSPVLSDIRSLGLDRPTFASKPDTPWKGRLGVLSGPPFSCPEGERVYLPAGHAKPSKLCLPHCGGSRNGPAPIIVII